VIGDNEGWNHFNVCVWITDAFGTSGEIPIHVFRSVFRERRIPIEPNKKGCFFT
jgi:hypothetical protein